MRATSRPGKQILWLVVCIVVVLSGVSAVLSVRHAAQSDDRATARALEGVLTSASTVEEYITQRIDVLQALATAPIFVEGNAEAQDAHFARLDVEAVGFGAGLGLEDLNGVMTAYSNATSPEASVDVSGRSYVRELLRTGEPYVGEAAATRPTGSLAIPISVPVRTLDGELTGLLVGALRLDAGGDPPLLRIVADNVTVVDRNGQVIVEHGAITAIRSVSADPAYAALLAEPTVVDLAGVARLVKLAGGDISVTSDTGAGSTSVVRLPLEQESAGVDGPGGWP